MLEGENVATGALDPCPECGVLYGPRVLESMAGFYIGYYCNCGPSYSRESDYYQDHGAALRALATGNYRRE